MAGTTLPPPQQQHQQAASAVSGTSATSGEEEAFKRNTDCVYFLASPLTCKKGSECEYRHSDRARMNPTDCWYWMHGNCLNPKCGFRHPPLEGLLGAQVPTPTGSAIPQHATSTPVAPASSGSGSAKQAVPCIFFQKGYCMKGDWCPFLHAPSSVSNNALPSRATATTTEPPNLKKSFGGPEKVIQGKMRPQASITKAVELPSQAKPKPRVESVPPKNEPSAGSEHLASNVGDDLPNYRTSDVPSVIDGTQVSWSGRVQQPMSLKDNVSMNDKDTEEISREPSPGFDVLVDNELGDSVYYPGEDQYGKPDDCEGRNKYFDRHSGDYSSMVDTDRDIYHDSRGYDSYERHQNQCDWEQRRYSSERMLGGLPAHGERSRYGRAGSPEQINETDLRHHLSSHSRTSGLRSVINQDYACERPDPLRYQNSRRDLSQDHEQQENSLSNRLQGRIKMPEHFPDDGNELLHGRRIEWQRVHLGLSQGSFQLSSRLRNRIKDRTQVDNHNDNKNKRGLPRRRETKTDDNVDFAGPKSLAELKSRKIVETNDQHVNYQTSVGKRKYSNVEHPQHTEGNLSFDGPKPLEEILKRKRGNEKAISEISTDGKLHNTQDKEEESLMDHRDKAEQQTGHLSPSRNVFSLQNDEENEISKSATSAKNEKESALLTDGQSSLSPNHNEAEGEMIVEEGAEDQEAENYAQEDGEYYERADAEAYDFDGDNGDPEGEYLDDDDDDDDDFAKKMGVMY